MKKIFTITVIFLLLSVVCWAGGQQEIEQAAKKFWEGDYYAYQFEQFKQMIGLPPITIIRSTKGAGGSQSEKPVGIVDQGDRNGGVESRGQKGFNATTGNPNVNSNTVPPTTREYGEYVQRPSWIQLSTPVEQDIDLAIAAYEASLAAIPSGTWRSDNQDLAPPEDGVKARLATAKRAKQEWLAAKPNLNSR
jgi:hypothetical protein